MARKSLVERNKKRVRLSKKYEARRQALLDVARARDVSPGERFRATLKLAELPRNSAPSRQRLRCQLTGRPRGNYRKFDLCRIALRELASKGHIPGMVKSSW